MPSKKYDLIFQGIDRVSGMIGGIESKLSRLQNSTSMSGGAFTKMGGAIAIATTALAVAGTAVGVFKNQLDSAVEAQLSQASAVVDSAFLMNASIDRTEQVMDRLTTTVAKNTSALPGSTKIYTELATALTAQVIPAVAGVDGAIDEQALIDKTGRVAKLFGYMGARINASAADVNSAATKALSGVLKVGELNQLDVFARNSVFKQQIEIGLKDMGVEQLSELTQKQRVEFFETLDKKLVSDGAVAKLSNTMSGRIEGLMTTFFDDTVGIFGFNRALKGRGNKKVIDAVSSTMGEIMDLMEAIGKIGTNAGLNFDTAGEFIFDRIHQFANYIDSIQKLVENNQPFFTGALKIFIKLFDALGKVFNVVFDISAYTSTSVIELGNSVMPVLEVVFDQIYRAIVQTVAIVRGILDLYQGKISGLSTISQALFTDDINFDKTQQSQNQQSFNAFEGLATFNELIQKVSQAFLFGGSTGKIAANISGANYSGFIPDSFLQYSAQEKAFNPSGGRQFITSENEFVFTPAQMRNLIGGIQKGSVQNFYITANTVSEQQYADMIVNTIKREWMEVAME
jgi:hypothetical protein